MITEIGFIPERRESTLYFDTAQKSYNQLTGATSKKRDLIINIRKPHLDELVTQLTFSLDEDPTTFAEKARAVLREALNAHQLGDPDERGMYE